MTSRWRMCVLPGAALAAAILIPGSTVLGQHTPSPQFELPRSLRGTIPEVRSLLDRARERIDQERYDAASADHQEALRIATARNFKPDIALAKAAIAGDDFRDGQFSAAVDLLHSALEDSLEGPNLALESEILVTLSAEDQLKGNDSGATDLLLKARDVAEQSKDPFVISHALGELGWNHLTSGRLGDAQIEITQALEIDRVNQFPSEALHLAYSGCLRFAQNRINDAQPILTQAEALSLKDSDPWAYVLARRAMAATYGAQGDVNHAIAELEGLDREDASTPSVFQIAFSTPIIRMTILESLASAYTSAKMPNKAATIWSELDELSTKLGVQFTEAEAVAHIADLKRGESDFQGAIPYYATAASLYERLGNETQLMRVLQSEALALIKVGRARESLEPEGRFVVLAAKRHDIAAQFTAYLVMAEVYQPAHEQAAAKGVLEKAVKLLDSDTTTPSVDNKLVLECYERLASAYTALGDNLDGLVAQERAIHVAQLSKSEADKKLLIGEVRERIGTMHLHELADQWAQQGNLKDSLVASEVIVVFEGPSAQPQNNADWNRTTTLPFTLVHQPQGPDALRGILTSMGPMLGISRLPILDALVGYYQDGSRDLPQAEAFARQADTILAPMSDAVLTLKVRTSCQLAWILAREGNRDQASSEVTRCVDLASRIQDKTSRDTANATNALVRAAINEVGSAEASISYLVAEHADDPALHAGLAGALAANGHYQEALGEFHNAIRLDEQSGSRQAVADTYLQMGGALSNDQNAADSKQQLASFESAREIYDSLGILSGEAKATLFIGFHYQKQKDYQKALETASKSLDLATKAGATALVASSAWLSGDVFATTNQPAKALQFHLRAYDSFEAVKDPDSAVLTLLAAAQDNNSLHESAEAVAECIKAEAMLTAHTPPATRISVERELGWLYVETGEFEKAISKFSQERDLAKTTDDPTDQGYANVALSDTFQLVGSWEDAAATAESGLQIFTKDSVVAGQASAEAQLMSIYSDRTSPIKDFDKAISYYQAAERDGYGPSLDLDVLEIFLQEHKYAGAIEIAQKRISECTADGDTDCQAHALISLSEAQGMAGDLASATANLQKAKPLVSRSADVYLHGRLLYGEANLARSAGKYDEAIEIYEQLINLIAQVKGELDPTEQRSVAETYGFIYDELVATLYQRATTRESGVTTRFADAAFRYAEADKARQFAESWGRTFISSMRSRLPPMIQEEELSLLERQQRLRAAKNANDAGGPQDTQKRLDINQAAFVKMLRSSYPDYAEIAYPETATIDQLPLSHDETLVEFKVTDDATFVWIVNRGAGRANRLLAFYKVPRTREWLMSEITKLRGGLTPSNAGTEDLTAAREIFNALFPDEYASDILRAKAIVFVPDDILFLIPFEILSPKATEGSFPLVGVPTRYYPSALAMKVSSATYIAHEWQEAFLGIGDPVTSRTDERYSLVSTLERSGFATPNSTEKVAGKGPSDDEVKRLQSRGVSFSRLPGTETELTDIANIFKAHHEDAETRLGMDATKTELFDTDLTRFRYLHFATHGILPTDLGISEPALILSFDGSSPDDMLLTTSEVLSMKIRADSVVLSACNTGSGEVSKAEGVMSLGRAFLSAGASSVTVSLWEVADSSTAIFMSDYYKHLLSGDSKAQALAAARLALFDGRYKDPYFWAPFILIGE